jgi:ornithine decarboxylase
MGGGFPANYANQPVDFRKFCAPINDVIQSRPAHIQLMAEPGRAISAPSMSLVSRVIGRSKRQDNVMWYYLDDGVYGAQSGRIYDHIDYPMHIFTDVSETGAGVFAGPTCDSIDYLGSRTGVPLLSIGDVIVIKEIGAYSVATACHFNGIKPPMIIDLDEGHELSRMLA